ncbi:MAG: tRNA (adenine(58)-N(1))-methyltransferase non-catalytic subunit trm6 [Alectoria sarmentosa]|nr:MAG: tRNA (adenine(58)-N(1))-methyltransferase non-catalytic subunit trm6 [Alectoria sarmentosa]CAD6586319.1 MAG: tRNA (adenine(58)-N(1))-methyltransferase non-catalytic subunit trm6 [Alectoria sarmentosa]
MIVQVLPNTTISIGKYGTFQANNILGRPYHLTFEIRDTVTHDGKAQSGLRVVPAAELYADIKDETPETPPEVEGENSGASGDGVEYEVVGQNGEVVVRTNRQIIDDPNSQIMTMDEIEALKAQSTGSGKELIAKILESHSALDQKTTFALAKYTLRKTKKYLRRFTVLPLDVPTLARWVLTDKEPMKIMELRGEILSLIGSWSNVHCTPSISTPSLDGDGMQMKGGRWLVIDETAGLLVAYMAEKMAILHPPGHDEQEAGSNIPSKQKTDAVNVDDANGEPTTKDVIAPPLYHPRLRKTSGPATTNTITLIHANAQPNLSLLKYFHFDAFNPSTSHPLESHLKTLSWLQLLSPEDDMGYAEPETVSEEVIQSWKSGKRSNYFRKRRRWERIKSIADETRAGKFDGLIVASIMSPVSILQHTVPLLRGAAQVVVYSPTIEPLVELSDYYSTARRTTFVTNPPDPDLMPTEDFPLNPTLLLAPTIQTARSRSWQVLPGRTHPLMTGRGGSEGYVFTATRVLPAEGKVEARGKFKRRKVDGIMTRASSVQGTPASGDSGTMEIDAS